jgi:hypothetical protein
MVKFPKVGRRQGQTTKGKMCGGAEKSSDWLWSLAGASYMRTVDGKVRVAGNTDVGILWVNQHIFIDCK